MPIDPLVAAKYLAKLSGWKLSNLPLQKILYIADMAYTGTYGERLLSENFEAWDYGPVQPRVYQACKLAGSSPIPPTVFQWTDDLPDESPEADALRKVWEALKNERPADLVRNTHWPKGAWYKRYSPERTGDCTITTEDMIEEYNARMAANSKNDGSQKTTN